MKRSLLTVLLVGVFAFPCLAIEAKNGGGSGGSSGSGITAVVEDTTPELGGALEGNGNGINVGPSTVTHLIVTGSLETRGPAVTSSTADVITTYLNSGLPNGATHQQCLSSYTINGVAVGGGTGNIDINLPVYSAKLSSAAGGAGALIDGGTDYWRLIYSSAVNTTALWQVKIPNYYSSGTLTLDLNYVMTTAVAGNVKWDAQFMRMSEQNFNNVNSYGVVNSSTVVVPNVLGYGNRVQIAITDAGGVKPGDTLRILLNRDTTVGSNAQSPAHVVGVSIRE